MGCRLVTDTKISPRRDLPIGVALAGVIHTEADAFDVDTRFRMVREAGVFDYVERSPPPGEIDLYRRASERYSLPIRAGSFYYVLGRDEALLEWHLRVGRDLGSLVQNVQILAQDTDGRDLTDQDIATFYLRFLELGERIGITPCLEVHVNMWSEHFGRVERVAALVERHGAPFRMTLDHSHVIFKIDHPEEQAVAGMRADIEDGELVLDPYQPNDVCSRWIECNYVRHAHARSTVPANPRNVLAHHPDGRVGRGIQYSFLRPRAGEWHAEWNEQALEPWKEVMRRLMRHHAREAGSPLGQISTEFIPFTDYGCGARYSIFENNVACARWLKETYVDVVEAERPVVK